jgi:putative SOS response-associated peptidase YedK
MCWRHTITKEPEVIEKRFGASFSAGAFSPRYNAAPSQTLPVILNSAPKAITLLPWGLKPPWIAKIGRPDELINVRAETLREKATFRRDLAERLCLVLADWFYEWQKTAGGRKAPFRFLMRDGAAFAFAG